MEAVKISSSNLHDRALELLNKCLFHINPDRVQAGLIVSKRKYQDLQDEWAELVDPSISPNSPNVFFEKKGWTTGDGKYNRASLSMADCSVPLSVQRCLNDIRKEKATLDFYNGYMRVLKYKAILASCQRVSVEPKYHMAKTGRFYSTNPNIQGLPNLSYANSPRDCIVTKGLFVIADYSQAELRILVDIIGHKSLIEKLNNGHDIYQEIADQIKVTRKAAKTLVLALIYGMGTEGLVNIVNLGGQKITMDQGAKLLNQVYSFFGEKFKTWKRKVSSLKSYELRSGLVIPIEKPYKAVNAIIQAHMAEVNAKSVVNICGGTDLKIAINVHDAVVLDLPLSTDFDKMDNYLKAVQVIMEKAYLPYNGIKMKVDIQHNDLNTKKYGLCSLDQSNIKAWEKPNEILKKI